MKTKKGKKKAKKKKRKIGKKIKKEHSSHPIIKENREKKRNFKKKERK